MHRAVPVRRRWAPHKPSRKNSTPLEPETPREAITSRTRRTPRSSAQILRRAFRGWFGAAFPTDTLWYAGCSTAARLQVAGILAAVAQAQILKTVIIHHLNCGSMCPYVVGRAVCHCLVVETPNGLLLVDTGLGARVSECPEQHMPAPLRCVLRPAFDPEQSVLSQLCRLGYSAEDVRHIVVTHLDLDHAGGILDFPDARVHVHGDELRAAGSPVGLSWRWRYRRELVERRRHWQVYEAGDGERWFGFDGVRQLEGLPSELLLVPLPGHTAGHCGVAIQGSNGWLVHAGDAYLAPGAVDYRRARPSLPLRLAQRITALDEARRRQSQLRLAHLVSQNQARVFCSHSSSEYQRWLREAGNADSSSNAGSGKRLMS